MLMLYMDKVQSWYKVTIVCFIFRLTEYNYHDYKVHQGLTQIYVIDNSLCYDTRLLYCM